MTEYPEMGLAIIWSKLMTDCDHSYDVDDLPVDNKGRLRAKWKQRHTK